MGENTRITDELRNIIEHNLRPDQRAGFIAIADRIDGAHALALLNAMQSAVKAADIFSNEYLAECGLVRLPVDADGKPWHVGDAYRFKDGTKTGDPDHIAWLTWDGKTWEANGEAIGHLERWKPTYAERIREWVNHKQGDSYGLDELLAIADEMEAGDEQ